MAEFRILKNGNGKMVWRFYQSGTFQTLAQSWKEYDSLSDCLYDIEVMRSQASKAMVDDDIKTGIEVQDDNDKKKKKKKRFFVF
ncbi:MAG: hypothetical protein ACMUHM_08075 [Thermoplasmatota archaeon]